MKGIPVIVLIPGLITLTSCDGDGGGQLTPQDNPEDDSTVPGEEDEVA